MRVLEARMRGEWVRQPSPLVMPDPEAYAQSYADIYNCSTRIVEISEKVISKHKPTK